jgi:hypothetical protein
VFLTSNLNTCLVILPGDICQLCIVDVGVNNSFQAWLSPVWGMAAIYYLLSPVENITRTD